jgi:hypothetical protein
VPKDSRKDGGRLRSWLAFKGVRVVVFYTLRFRLSSRRCFRRTSLTGIALRHALNGGAFGVLGLNSVQLLSEIEGKATPNFGAPPHGRGRSFGLIRLTFVSRLTYDV